MINFLRGANNRRDDGYTLVEVLVALTLLSVAIIPLMTSYVVSWRSSEDGHRRSRAAMLARWKMGQLRAVEGFTGVSSKSVSDCVLKEPYRSVGDTYDCKINVKRLTTFNTSADKQPKQVTVNVLYVSPFGGRSSVKLTSTFACLDPRDCS